VKKKNNEGEKEKELNSNKTDININLHKPKVEYKIIKKEKVSKNKGKIKSPSPFLNKNFSNEELKNLYMLMQNKESLKQKLNKLEQNKKILDNITYTDKVDNNIKNYKLKKIINTKNIIEKKLDQISEQLQRIMEGEKKRKNRINLDFHILENEQEKYNTHLLQINKKENQIRMKYFDSIKQSYEKKKKKIDEEEKKKLEQKIQKIKIAKSKEKEIFLKRKERVDRLIERSQLNKKENSNRINLYVRHNNTGLKLDEKNKMKTKIYQVKKKPLVTRDEIEDLEQRIEEYKNKMKKTSEEQTKKLKELWYYRSKTLPLYHHPILTILKKELNDIKEAKEEKMKRIETNELDKKNYKPPKVIVNISMKKSFLKKIQMTKKEDILNTKMNNKKRMQMKLSPLRFKVRKKLEHQFSFNKSTKNNIILHNISNLNTNRNNYKRSPSIKKITNPIIKENLSNLELKDELNNEKIKIEYIDNKIKLKKELLNAKGGYKNNSEIALQIGDLLLDSVKRKFKILSKLYEY
jgi:hypothetical protein